MDAQAPPLSARLRGAASRESFGIWKLESGGGNEEEMGQNGVLTRFLLKLSGNGYVPSESDC